MLQGIQCLRAAAALLVVLHHAVDVQEKHGRGPLPLLSGFSGEFAVDLLFVVSGLIIVLVIDGRGGSWSSAVEFLRKRVSRIVPTYWFYTTILVALALIVPQVFERFRPDAAHTLQSYLFWPARNPQGRVLPVLAVGWTLQYEMYFYLVLTALLLLPPRWLVPALTGLFGSCVALGVICPTDSPPLQIMTSPVLFDLLLGAWLAQGYRRGVQTPRRLGLALLIAGGSVLLTVGALGIEPKLSRVLWFGLPSAAVVWGVLSLERGGVRAFPRALVRIGDTSYSLYLGHVLVLAAIGKVWTRMGLREVCPDVVLLATLILASLVLAETSYRLVEDPSRRMLARLAPSRSRSRQTSGGLNSGEFSYQPSSSTGHLSRSSPVPSKS
jgi:exopolysaccharide production protein ExoZ